MGYWAKLTRPNLGLVGMLAEQIGRLEEAEPDLIPDLRSSEALYIGSDYSGDHKGPKYEICSFVVTSSDAEKKWDCPRRARRQKYLSHPSFTSPPEMSYKALNGDRARLRALPEFLKLADSLPGVVLTVAIDKGIRFLSPEALAKEGKFWKPEVFDRVLRCCHFVGMLASCLSRPGQNIAWFTDRDKIADTDDRKQAIPAVLGQVIASLYLPHKLGCVIVADNEGDSDMSWSDFLAIPDVISGAFAEVLNQHGEMFVDAGLVVTHTTPLKDVQPKTKDIID